MHHWAQVIFTTIAIYAAVIVTPGPNFIVVTRTAVSAWRQAAVATALGVALASAFFATLSLSGLSFVLARFAWIHMGIEIAGGLYVFYLGATMWLQARLPPLQERLTGMPAAGLRAWRRGFLTNISNPKSIAFFVGLFAVSLKSDTPGWVKTILVAMVFCFSAAWYTIVALCFSRVFVQTYYLRMKMVTDRLVGGLLVIVGIKLVIAGTRRASG